MAAPLSLLPRTPRSSSFATLGLDLTGLGVATDTTGAGEDLPVEKADLARIASYTRAAHLGGISLVTLGAAFRLRSDRAVRRDGWLDPIVATRRVAPHAAGGLVPQIPAGADLHAVDTELAQSARNQGSWTGLHVTGPDAARLAGARRPASRGPRPRIVLTVAGEGDVEAAGRYADVVRIRETDADWARELRYAVRGAARAAGREGAVKVIADVHTVVAADRSSAEERAGLIADIAGPNASWAGALSVHGTTTDVAELIQSWIHGGAADGFVVIPGSLPADVAAVIRGVVPELRSRGLLDAHPTPAAAPATTARPAVAPVRRTARERLPAAL